MTKKVLALSIGTILLMGCSKASPSISNTEEITISTEETTEEVVNNTSLPIISISTKNTSSDVMNFVNEPVARHVAESITWIPNYVIPPEPYYEDCTIKISGSDGNAFLSDCEAKVKVRGNWTTYYPKKPLKIKFTDKQNLLGLNDGAEQKNWLLLAEYKDASILRNRAALYMSREILKDDDLFCADSTLVQVEINGEYYGVYLLSDMQQVSSHRVDITEPIDGYEGTDIGYFLEYDGYYFNEDALHEFDLDFADNAPLTVYNGGNDEVEVNPLPKKSTDKVKPVGMTIKSTINSQQQHDFISQYVNNVYRIMYEAAYNDRAYKFNESYTEITEVNDITPQQAVENVVDIQSLVDMYIISELTCDADLYWSSFYMDVDFGPEGNKKLTFEAPWDFDSSMGNKDRCIDGKGYYASNLSPDVNGGANGGGEYDTINPWLVILAHEDWYRDIISKTWTKAYDNGVFDRTYELIETNKSSYENDFKKNYKKWNNIIENDYYVNELSSPARKCKNEAEAADFLLKWLKSRVDFLNSEFHE